MDIKEALEVAEEMKSCFEYYQKERLDFQEALKTLIDYCSEPKVELDKEALTKFLIELDFEITDKKVWQVHHYLARKLCSHFKLSVVSMEEIKKEIYKYIMPIKERTIVKGEVTDFKMDTVVYVEFTTKAEQCAQAIYNLLTKESQ